MEPKPSSQARLLRGRWGRRGCSERGAGSQGVLPSAASSPEGRGRFRRHCKARSRPPNRIDHAVSKPPFSWRNAPAAWLQTTTNPPGNQSCESCRLSPTAPGLGSARYLWVHYLQALSPLFVGHHTLQASHGRVSADQQTPCSRGDPFSVPRMPRAGPRPGVLQLLLPLRSGAGGSSGCWWQEGFQPGLSLEPVPAAPSAEKAQSILPR